MPSSELTDTQRRVLRYVMEQTALYAVSPTIDEIGTMFGFASKRGVTCHLDALVRKGHLARSSSPRSLRVLRDPEGRPVALRYVVAEESAPPQA